MEALTSVSVAALALIDMVKAIDPGAVLTDIRVEWKEGGKTGEYRCATSAEGACHDQGARWCHGVQPGGGRACTPDKSAS